MVRIVAYLSGQIEGHRQTGLPLLQQVAVAGVGLGGGGVAGVLAHGPEPTPEHGGLNPSGEGIEARIAQVFTVLETDQTEIDRGGQTRDDVGGGRDEACGRSRLPVPGHQGLQTFLPPSPEGLGLGLPGIRSRRQVATDIAWDRTVPLPQESLAAGPGANGALLVHDTLAWLGQISFGRPRLAVQSPRPEA